MGVKRIEKILVAVVVAGVIFKLLHLPGAYPMIILGVGSLANIYFLAAWSHRSSGIKFLKKWFDSENQKSILVPNFIFGYVLAISLVGILFKVMLYPGHESMLIFGLIGFAIAVAYSLWKSKPNYNHAFLGTERRLFIIGGLLVVFTLISTNTLVEVYYPNNPEFATALKELHKNPGNRELQERVQNLRLEMQNK